MASQGTSGGADERDGRFPAWVRYSGLGLELAGAIGGFALIGYWIDSRFGTGPWGIVSGVVLGMVGGFYNFVRQSLEALRDARTEDAAAERDERGSDPESGG